MPDLLPVDEELTVEDIASMGSTSPVFDISHVQIDRALASQSLYDFVEMCWPLVEPGRDFIPNWHVEAICEHLQAVARGDIHRLVINIPPGCMKSLTCGVFFPAWLWTFKPETKFIYASYSSTVSRRDAIRHRQIVESKWFTQRWTVTPNRPAQWGATLFGNKEGGMRLSTSVGGGVTGHHADIQVVDDPLKPFEVSGSLAVSRTALDNVLAWWNETMATRMVSAANSSRIIIMQRLHMDDLAGAVLREGGYEHLCLPMEAESKNRCKTSLNFKDTRKEGELLWPARFPKSAVDRQKKELGSRASAAQLQQRPSPLEGAIFKRSWVRYYKPSEFALPSRCYLTQSWDMAFKGTSTSDYVVGQVWAHIDGKFYLMDQIRERMTFGESCRAVINMTARWPKATSKLIEDKANGPAIADTLKKTLTGIIMVNPEGGKEARANAVQPLWEAGDVFIPHPDECSWSGEFIEELCSFPSGSHDDQVDAMTQALARLRIRSMVTYKQAMEKIR